MATFAALQTVPEDPLVKALATLTEPAFPVDTVLSVGAGLELRDYILFAQLLRRVWQQLQRALWDMRHILTSGQVTLVVAISLL